MMNGSLLIGAGGHAKVIADILKRRGERVLGFVDDNAALIGQTVFDLPVLGEIDRWPEFAPDGLLAAIGDNRIRCLVVERVEANGSPQWINALHPQSIIAESASIASGTVIMAGAVVNADAVIGQHVIVNTGATVDHDCVIGDFAHIAPGVNLAGGVTVGAGAFLGIGSCVIPGCHIGAGAIIGAGATVVGDVASGQTVVGTPARPLTPKNGNG